MNTDITDAVQRYRLALRFIWNACIWIDPALRNWDSVYSFRELKLPLFRTLIADPLQIRTGGAIFGSGFRVVPAHEAGLPLMQVNVRVPSSPSEGIWEPLNGPFNQEELTMTLLDLFDWTPLGYIDLRYYIVLIESFRGHTERVGQHALIDVNHAGVLWVGEETAVGNIPGSSDEHAS